MNYSILSQQYYWVHFCKQLTLRDPTVKNQVDSCLVILGTGPLYPIRLWS